MTRGLLLVATGAALAIRATVGVVVARGDEPSSWTFSIPADLPPTAIVPPDRVSPAVRREALAVARHDPTVQALTAGGHVVGADVWGDGDGRLLGANLTFRLPAARAVDAVLPVADIPPDAPTTGVCEEPYRPTWLHEQSEGVTEISVLVDIRRNVVASVGTNAKAGRFSWVEGKAHPNCEAVEAG